MCVDKRATPNELHGQTHHKKKCFSNKLKVWIRVIRTPTRFHTPTPSLYEAALSSLVIQKSISLNLIFKVRYIVRVIPETTLRLQFISSSIVLT